MEREEEVVRGKVEIELVEDNLLKELREEREIGDRTVVFFRSFGSRLCFFRRGRTMAVLKLSGTEPVCMEVLMMSVMKGRSWRRPSE